MARHKIKGIPGIGLTCDYGNHDIYTGEYREDDMLCTWIQAGDDNEGNSNGNPAAGLNVTSEEIILETDDGIKITWKVPEYKFELKEIEDEINHELEKYFSQYIKQPMFIKKD